MLITCPSCGKTHDSAKYRGEFEIACDCGYSILIPDEDALSQPVDEGAGFQAPPIAMDEEDNSIAIDVDDGTNAGAEADDKGVEAANPFAPFDGATDMTPESELPSGMLYDPDEADSLAESKEAWSQNSSAQKEFLDPFASEAADAFAEEVHALPEMETVNEPLSPAQTLVKRNQSAALGHLVGSSFDLNFSSLGEPLLLKMATKCEELLNNHPWIKQLVEDNHSKCSAEDFMKRKQVSNIPEVLALELFLYCFELGGNCSFSATESLELHTS